MKPLVALTLLALVRMSVVPFAEAGRLDGTPVPAPAVTHRDDAVVVRLTVSSRARTAERFLTRSSDAAGGRPLAPAPPAGLAAAAADLGVRLEPEFPAAWAALRRGPPAASASSAASRLQGYWIARVPRTLTVDVAIARLRALADVDTVFPIARVPVTATPNDSLWSTCDHLYRHVSRRDIHAPEAWDLTRGDTAIVAGIMDTGVLMSHPDLVGTVPGRYGNLFVHRAELDGVAGVDDDGNGYVDDVHGWDFVDFDDPALGSIGEDVRDEDADPNDYVGHGTAVAGVVGAITDNVSGVPGVAWNVRIMPLRVGWSSPQRPSGEIDLSAVARAIDYASRMGVTVVNGSFASVYQADLADAIEAALDGGLTIVVAGGNFGSPHEMADHPDIVGVAATDSLDHVTGFSNTGTYIDLSAPGLFVSTTALFKDLGALSDSVALRVAGYTTTASGTSFAAPMVTGAVALLQAHRRQQGLPPLSPGEVLDRLVDTADDIAAENPDASGYGSGRLDAYRLLVEPRASWRAALPAPVVGPFAVLPSVSGGSRIAAALADGTLMFLNGNGGGRLWTSPLGAPPAGGVAAASLGPDPDRGGVGLFVVTQDGRVHGLDAAGARLPGWPIIAYDVVGGGASLPSLGDVDGDGSVDVVLGGTDGRVRAWGSDGRMLPGFPLLVASLPGKMPHYQRVALADVDSIPGVEIVVQSRTGYFSSTITLIRPRAGGPSWSHEVGYPILTPIVAALGHARRIAVISAANQFVKAYSPAGEQLWRVTLPHVVAGALAAGDVTGDGVDELFVPYVSDGIAVLDSAGALIVTLRMDGKTSPDSPYPAPLVGPVAPGATGIAWSVLDRLDIRSLVGTPPPGYPRISSGWGSVSYGTTLGAARASIVAATNRGRPLLRGIALPSGTTSDTPPPWATEGGDVARTGSRLGGSAPARIDDVPPNRIVDLEIVAIESHRLGLRWTAPADPVGIVARYEVRVSLEPITEATAPALPVAWSGSPSLPGTAESATIGGLPENRQVYVAIQAIDVAGNAAPLSNVASTMTASVAPSRISDLRLRQATTTSLVLQWTATGDDGQLGAPTRYHVRGSTGPIDAAAFDSLTLAQVVDATAPPGAREAAEFIGLERGARYWFAVVAEDAAGNRSPVSNVLSIQTGPLARSIGMALATALQPARAPVDLFWQVDGRGAAEITIFDVGGRRVRSIALEPATEGIARWDGRDKDGRRAVPGLYLARLRNGSRHAVGRIVLLD